MCLERIVCPFSLFALSTFLFYSSFFQDAYLVFVFRCVLNSFFFILSFPLCWFPVFICTVLFSAFYLSFFVVCCFVFVFGWFGLVSAVQRVYVYEENIVCFFSLENGYNHAVVHLLFFGYLMLLVHLYSFRLLFIFG